MSVVSLLAGAILGAAGAPITATAPMMVRLNGTTGFTTKVLPKIANKTLGNSMPDRFNLVDDKVLVMGFGVKYQTYFKDLKLKSKFDEQSVKASFKQSGNDVRLGGTLKMSGATLKGSFVVKSSLQTPFNGIMPQILRDASTINIDTDFQVTGLNGAVDMTFRRGGSLVEISQVHDLDVKVDKLEIKNHQLIQSAANLLFGANNALGISKLFGFSSPKNVTEACTAAANSFLANANQFKNELKQELNSALNANLDIDIGKMASGLGQPYGISIEPTLLAISSRPNTAKTEWRLRVGANKQTAPDLPFTTPNRLGESLESIGDDQGDIQIFVPWSTVDLFCYQAYQNGMFQRFDVPAGSTELNGAPLSFQIKLLQSPVSNLSANSRTLIELVAPAEITNPDGSLGRIKIAPSIPVPNVPNAPIKPSQPTASLESVRGTATVKMKITQTSGGAVILDIVGVSFSNLSGTIKVGSASIPVANTKALLESVIATLLSRSAVRMPLIKEPIQLVNGISVIAQQPRAGSFYLRLPFDIR